MNLPRLICSLASVKLGLRASRRIVTSAMNPATVVGIARYSASREISPPKSTPWTLPSIPKDIRCPHYSENGGVSPWKDITPLALPIGPPEWHDLYLAEGMREAGRRAAESLKYAVSLVTPGVTTREIDRKLTEWAFSHGCYPSSLNYGRFPGSLCTSVNNVLSHGVPNEYPA